MGTVALTVDHGSLIGKVLQKEGTFQVVSTYQLNEIAHTYALGIPDA
jgi:hypothetical protein